MRKGLYVGLALALFGSLVISPASAAITAGNSCTRLNQTLISAGYTYTCIKSGKKLSWKKGVAVKKSTPIPISTPTPTPIPTSIPTPTPTSTPTPGDVPVQTSLSEPCVYPWYYFRINNGVMERSFYPDHGFTSSDPRPRSLFDPIMVKAYEAIRNHKSTTTSIPAVEMHVSADFPKDELDFLTTQMRDVVAYWGDRFAPNSTVIATFGTQNSDTSNWENYMANKDDANWIINMYKDPTKSGYLNCGWKNGIAGSHTLFSGSNRGKIGYWIIFPTQHDGSYWLPKNLPHEFTHGIQDLIWIVDGYPAQSKGIYNVIEGGAELFGTALANPNIGWYADEVNRFIVENYLGNPPTHSIPQSTSDILSMLNTSEKMMEQRARLGHTQLACTYGSM